MTAKPGAVDAWLVTLDAETLACVNALRAIIAGANRELVEDLKWNAPNFSHRGEDRVTLGLNRRGGVRVVLHRGARVRDASEFRFDDPAGLPQWPAADRATIEFASATDVEASRVALSNLIGRWIVATC